MVRFVLRRLLGIVPLVLLVSLVCFALMHAVPGGPEGVLAENPKVKPEDLARIRDDRLTALLEEGAHETDEPHRVKIYHEIADILVDEVPVIPLFWYTAVDACTDRLHNYKPNPTQSADTWNANTWYLTD